MSEEVSMSESLTVPPGNDPLLDEEWLAAATRKPRLRIVLVACLVASLCFLGGALVQKQFGSGGGAVPMGPAGGAMPTGMPSGMPGGMAGGTSGGAAASSDGDSDSSSAVIGKVISISGDTWTVENLGGKRQKVKVSGSTNVVRESDMEADDVKVGDAVDISGNASGDQIDAQKVTLR